MTEPANYGLIPSNVNDQRDWLVYRGYVPIMERSKVPTYSGVYVVYSQAEDSWLYVGQSRSIRGRVYCGEHAYPQAKKLGFEPILYVKELDAPEYMYEESLMVGLLRPTWNFGQHPSATTSYENWKRWKHLRDRKDQLEAHRHTPDHNEFKTNESMNRLIEVLESIDSNKFESANKLFKEVVRTGKRIHGVSIGPRTFYKFKELWWDLLTDNAKALSRSKSDAA